MERSTVLMHKKQISEKKTKKVGFFKKLYREHKSLMKPTKKQWLKGTVSTFGIAVAAALSISAVDSVFTALLGLFLS